MRISPFSPILFLLIFVLLAGRLSAQNYVTTVNVEQDSLLFSAPAGGTSEADSLTISAGRIGGRFHLYFEGSQAGYFKLTGRVWKKVKQHDSIKLALLFSPPASFKGIARAQLRVKGISLNTWKVVQLVGRVE